MNRTGCANRYRPVLRCASSAFSDNTASTAASPLNWAQTTASAQAIQLALSRLRAALLDCAANSSSPALDEAGATLVQVLHEHLPHLRQASAHAETLPAELRQTLQQLGAEIQHLAEWNTRLSAATQRALAVLLPETAPSGYARLGGGRASPFSVKGSGSGYLKA